MQLPDITKTLVPWVGRTAKMQRQFIVDQLREHQLDLTYIQWLLLAKLFHEDGRNQNDLAIVTDRNKASLTRLINTLEKKNLVARIPVITDKRVNRIHLTKHGYSVFEQTLPIINNAFDKMQEGLSAKEKEYSIKVLQKIQHNIQKQSK